ncbi:sulfatase [Oceaniferula spumae]|uniref:Sulfatase n=1 Tax=Oceaniferula spumae TaxID=2979115 RepID=A0AAT9FGI3_9BACT
MRTTRNIISAILLASTCLAGAQDDKVKKPNLLFILVDDFGAMDVGYAGSKLYATPNIDSLAKDGMNFKNAYSAHPRCLPSRYGIFSGRIPGRDGVPGFQDQSTSKNALIPSRVTWGEVLKDAGYSTGYIGKWHLCKDETGTPDKQGFTDSRIAGHAGAPASYFYPYDEARQGKSKELFPKIEGKPGEYLTDRLTDEAIDFIEKNKAKPFALVLAHYAVHTPIEAKPEMTDKYKNKLKDMGVLIGDGKKDADFKTVGHGAFKTVQNHPVYAAMIESVDKGIGEIRGKLKELGLDENTIIVLSSDHGGLSTRSIENNREVATSNLPYRNGKGWLYEGGTRVPMLVVWPGVVKPGSVTTTQTIGIDHYPSFVEMCGAKVPDGVEIDGKSYVDVLLGKQVDRGPIYWHSPLGRPHSTGDHAASSLIDGDWKILQFHVTGKWELYNLKTDPGELKDLSTAESETFERMKKQLLATQDNLGVKFRFGEYKGKGKGKNK